MINSHKLILFDKLIKNNSDAYIKFKDANTLIYTEFLDFKFIKQSLDYYNNEKMKFETINTLPVLLQINNIKEKIYILLYQQLLTGLPPIFNSINDQISYIMLLEQLTGGDFINIKQIVKEIKFDPKIYTLIIDYGININVYINKYITHGQIILSFLSKYNLLHKDYNNFTHQNINELCKYDLDCKCHNDITFKCRFKHTEIEIDSFTKSCLVKDLSYYNLLFIGENKFFDHKHNINNYDYKLLSKDNIVFDIIYQNSYIFAFNTNKYVDREKYKYKEYDKYDDEITVLIIDNEFIKLKKVALFKSYNCCGSIFYHNHNHGH